MLQVSEIEEAEKDKMRAKCEKIVGHGINCFINRQLIYNFPEQVVGALCLDDLSGCRSVGLSVCLIPRANAHALPTHLLMQLFTEAGLISIEHADFEGVERLAAVTGGWVDD